MTHFLLFHTIHDVLKAEKILKKQGFKPELVPIPRNLSSDCGMCIKVEDNLDKILPPITHIDIDRCFLFDGKDYRRAENG
jgi:hypothetical protein